MSVCFWESGGISRLTDDTVIGLYGLIVERDVTEREFNTDIAFLYIDMPIAGKSVCGN
jgi:hypothetical protein